MVIISNRGWDHMLVSSLQEDNNNGCFASTTSRNPAKLGQMMNNTNYGWHLACYSVFSA